jgi:Protein of unknown function (DUF4054)
MGYLGYGPGPDINVLFGWWGTTTYVSNIGIGQISAALNLGPFGGNPPYQVSDFLSIYPKFGTWAQAIQAVTFAGTMTGYAVGDTLVPVQPDASGALITVGSVDANGSILTATVTQGGEGFSIASNLPTTTSGAGTGALVNVTQLDTPNLVANLPLAVLQLYIALASSSLSSERWGPAWPLAMALYVAHFATLYLRSEGNPGSTPGRIAASGLARGIIVSSSAGGVSKTIEVPKGLEDWGMWTSTEYGVQLATLAQTVGMGMIYAY